MISVFKIKTARKVNEGSEAELITVKKGRSRKNDLFSVLRSQTQDLLFLLLIGGLEVNLKIFKKMLFTRLDAFCPLFPHVLILRSKILPCGGQKRNDVLGQDLVFLLVALRLLLRELVL